MKIEKIKCSQLSANTGQVEGLPKNPRQWTRSDLERLARSLKETPELFEARPCLVYPHEGKYIILGGNMRFAAAKENGAKEVPCIVFPPDTPAEKLREIVIKDNGAFGSWDFDDLANEWDDLPLVEFGVPVWDGDIATAGGLDFDKEIQEDEFDEDTAPIEARCKLGEIWQLGEHRLMCGDSTLAEDVAKLMGEERADMIFTDPPYGVSYAEKNEFLNALGTGHRLTQRIENDDHSPEEMYEFWCKAFANLYTFSKEKMAYYITAPQGGDLLLLLLQAIRDSGFMLKHQLVWNKNNHVLGRCDYNYKHEPIIYGWKIGGTHTFYGGGAFKTSVWDIARPLQSKLHPTMKPVELVANCLKDVTKEGDIVLDIFGGSGTTIMAAEQLGRKARLMELDPHYCDVIIQRWEDFSQRKATKIA